MGDFAMSLRESTRQELSALGLHVLEAPATASAETWFTCEDATFAAVIWQNRQTSNWQYRVYQRDERGIMIPVASDYGLSRFPEHRVRGKLQELMIAKALGDFDEIKSG
jgi:hypothetical protein